MAMKGRWQRTLKEPLRFAGVGLHSGQRVAIQLLPAPENSGIVFRTGLAASRTAIPALIANVDARKSQLCTQLAGLHGQSVSTAEHLMAALVASRITNVWVDFDVESHTPTVELPVLDGSSLEYMEEIQRVGVEAQEESTLNYLRIKRPVQVLKQDKAAWLLPMPEQLGGSPELHEPTLQMSVQVNFEHKQLGTKFCRFALGADPDATMAAFHEEIAPARTFTFEDEIEWMQANGLARGGSLDNAVVFAERGQATVLNKEGLRFPDDEWARHKMLDCIGDIGLAGLPLHGYFFATSPGHALTHELLRELFKDPKSYEEVS